MFNVKNILYPINLDSENISPVISAIELAKIFKSNIHILYVNDPDAGYRHPADFEDAIGLKLQEVVPQELLQYERITYAVAKGNLGEEVSQYCKENNIDLLVTGHKHRNKLYSMLFDTPDENIIDSVNLPILIFPKK